MKNGTRSTYPVSDVRSASGGFATTAVAVNNTPLPSVVVLQRVTSGGVVITSDPTELVVVKTIASDSVEVAFSVIVSHFEDVVETTITRDR